MVQLEAIRRLEGRGGAHRPAGQAPPGRRPAPGPPGGHLSQLAERFDPPITKSALNHRLRKLVELGRES